MLNQIIALTAVTALASLLMPSRVDAWGAANVSYSHVGPGGVYHASQTTVGGPGPFVGGRFGAYGTYGGVSGGVYGASFAAPAVYAAPFVPPIAVRYPGRTVSTMSYTYIR